MKSSSGRLSSSETASVNKSTELFDAVIIALNTYLSASKTAILGNKSKRVDDIKSIANFVYGYYGKAHTLDGVIEKVLTEENLSAEAPELLPLPSAMSSFVEPEPSEAVVRFEEFMRNIAELFKTNFRTGFMVRIPVIGTNYNVLSTGWSNLKTNVESAIRDADVVLDVLKKKADEEHAFLLLTCCDKESHEIKQADIDALLMLIPTCLEQVAIISSKPFYINDVGYTGKIGKSQQDVIDGLNEFCIEKDRWAFGLEIHASENRLYQLSKLLKTSTREEKERILQKVVSVHVWNTVDRKEADAASPVVIPVQYKDNRFSKRIESTEVDESLYVPVLKM